MTRVRRPRATDVIDVDVKVVGQLRESTYQTFDVGLVASFVASHHVGVEADAQGLIQIGWTLLA